MKMSDLMKDFEEKKESHYKKMLEDEEKELAEIREKKKENDKSENK